jgi:membrane protein DedA with SNARE-associated domain
MMEGETGLVMAGILCHTGDMTVPVAIIVAGLGSFLMDQIWFYVGRYNKKYVHKKFSSHKRKFARSRLLLRKYGVWVIFIQRFIYGMRTIVPIVIGMSGYDKVKFAIVNFISGFVWAALTIIPAYIFGEELIGVIHWVKEHWYFGIMFGALIIGSLYYISIREDR